MEAIVKLQPRYKYLISILNLETTHFFMGEWLTTIIGYFDLQWTLQHSFIMLRNSSLLQCKKYLNILQIFDCVHKYVMSSVAHENQAPIKSEVYAWLKHCNVSHNLLFYESKHSNHA